LRFYEISCLIFANLKGVQLSAYAQNHKSYEYVPKYTTVIVSDVWDFAWSD